jgi:hypothetical protein
MSNQDKRGKIVAVKMPRELIDFIRRNPKIAQKAGLTLMGFRQTKELRAEAKKALDTYANDPEFDDIRDSLIAKFDRATELAKIARDMFFTGRGLENDLEDGTMEELQDFCRKAYKAFMVEDGVLDLGEGDGHDVQKLKDKMEKEVGVGKVYTTEIGFNSSQKKAEETEIPEGPLYIKEDGSLSSDLNSTSN